MPSIIFGLLGLAVFINFFHVPRSVPIVGGLVLTLMTLPTIIITSRAAIKSVPPSIREAALGMGASKYQVVLHHVLPLALWYAHWRNYWYGAGIGRDSATVDDWYGGIYCRYPAGLF